MHSRRLPNYKVVSGYSLLGLREKGGENLLGALWDDDPVHLNMAGYAIMVESLMDYMVEESSSFCNKPRVKEQRQEIARSAWICNESPGEAGPSRKRGRPQGWYGGAQGGGGGWRGGRGGGSGGGKDPKKGAY